MHHRRRGALVGAVLLTLTACGSSPGSESGGADSASATEAPAAVTDETATPEESAPADEVVTTGAPITDAADEMVAPTADDGAASPDGDDSSDDGNPSDDGDAGSGDSDTDTDTDTQPVATDAPAPGTPAAPVVGGRSFAPDVQPDAQFDGNPFPDLVVDDIGKDAQVNIRNILPSDRPVLLWAWAPH